ncbi:hypothetical protein ACLOJK_022966, partial [Asimina triloba]
MYRHVDFSPTAITLAAKENWLTLIVAATDPHPSHRAISATLAVTPAPRPSRKVISTPVATTTTPQRLHEASCYKSDLP